MRKGGKADKWGEKPQMSADQAGNRFENKAKGRQMKRKASNVCQEKLEARRESRQMKGKALNVC